VFLGLCLALAAPALASDPGPGMGLTQAIQKALTYSPNLQAAQEDVTAARAARAESQTSFLPALNTNYKFTGLQHVTHTRTALGWITTGSQYTYQWTNSLSQPLFTGFNLLATYRLADLGVDVAQTQLRLTLLDLVLTVKESFFDYLRAQKAEEWRARPWSSSPATCRRPRTSTRWASSP
jgi:outer membrane protein